MQQSLRGEKNTYILYSSSGKRDKQFWIELLIPESGSFKRR